MFKCLYGLAPQYLADLIAVTPQSRYMYNLRSRNATLLVSAKAWCLPTLGDRAFQSAVEQSSDGNQKHSDPRIF